MVGTPIPAVAGSRNLALDSRSSMVEQEEAGEDGDHEASKFQASAFAGLGRDKYGCAGVDMATLPYELAPKEFSGQEEDQQRSKHATSRSVNVKKSLLVKQKSSVVNAQKPPIEKRRKPAASNVQFVRSPLLNKILTSPRMGHSGAKHQRSPYAGLSSSTLPNDTRMAASPNLGRDSSRTGKRLKPINRALGRRSTTVEEDEVGEDEGDEATKIQELTSGRGGIHMETLPFEIVLEDVGQQRNMQQQGGKDAASRIKSLLSKRKSSVVSASNHSEGIQRKSSVSHVHYVRSPVLNRMLHSPRMSQSPVLSARSSSSSSSDDTRIVISPDLGPELEPNDGSIDEDDCWADFEQHLAAQKRKTHICKMIFSLDKRNLIFCSGGGYILRNILWFRVWQEMCLQHPHQL
ncbi:uncharacterized protein LOC110436565 isoform X2 [Sorghum bicolor]|uniref:uncharacterized protein LOC110436565 isoform X2 n=1 Tax=Sorghum bicolor TaxID=4558 RepID=UPI000B423F28|nr:uncharacterized protein LOC110436565 isoform X2 [Sorghum bicolor]|eukprot:XP_021319550.1 uncharacterized protein LOC110436565 isoform X2 [Sorghum bicolor]